MTWPKLAEYLQEVAPERRCDVRLTKRLPPDKAIKEKGKIAERIADLFQALLVVYEA
jgi:hypothetical protein